MRSFPRLLQDHQRRRAAVPALRLFPADHALALAHLYSDGKLLFGTTGRDREPDLDVVPARCWTRIAMAYRLIEAAQSRWRAVNAPDLGALVRAGAKFETENRWKQP